MIIVKMCSNCAKCYDTNNEVISGRLIHSGVHEMCSAIYCKGPFSITVLSEEQEIMVKPARVER